MHRIALGNSPHHRIDLMGNSWLILLLCLVPTACGLANLESLEVRTCGLGSVEFRSVVAFHSHSGAWFGKSLGRDRVNGGTDAVWLLPLPLMCELFTSIARETPVALTSPQTTSILPVKKTGNNANHGRNSWKDRP
ncbi:hypothetical protein AVEN_185283-1 [Araneus ventricosus]|uniref:Uncharacterized protein n=1 Tax=Araneus ventricosus TaxID=182803 RepID=A0A4Y2KUQ2_ARAVE|nr:hypothetical protein AVEN_185283-1 [Araneus ventricosus]